MKGWSLVLSVSVHLGLPWLVMRLSPEATPRQQAARLLNVDTTFEASSGEAEIRRNLAGSREHAPEPQQDPPAPRERRHARARAPEPARHATQRATRPATEPSRAVAASPMPAPIAASPVPAQASGSGLARGHQPTDASGASRAKAATAALARYLSSARERVREHRQYPHLARRTQLEGTVCLRVSITASGDVRQLRVTCGESLGLLVQAAVRSVKDAAPFAPLPGELGRELTIELPVVFELAM